MYLVRALFFVFICLQITCKEEVTSTEGIITASTSKRVYQQGEEILVYINNNLGKNIFLQKFGWKLYPHIEALEGGSGITFITVCRELLSFKLNSSVGTCDTLELHPGRYRIKYYYDYENIEPVFFNEILMTNEFKIE